MNSKVKGVLQVLLVLVLIAAFAFVAARGIGGAHRGSAKNNTQNKVNNFSFIRSSSIT